MALRLARLATLSALALVAGCNNFTYPQRESPANAYKDYRPGNQDQASVIGVGEPISARQAAANATIRMSGEYDLAAVMQRIAGTYNLAVRWGNGVRRDNQTDVVIKDLTFDEARNYIEDVYNVQIIKEGERRLLVLPSASEPRLAEFAPGNNVTLAEALRGLADQCNYNLVVNENRDQLNAIRVSTKLKDITCQDAFDALLNPQGLSLDRKGDFVTIAGFPQRQWAVNLFEPVRSEEVEVNYTSDFSSGSSSGSTDSSSGSSGGSGSMSAGGSSKVTVTQERDLWEELKTDLEKLIENNCIGALGAETALATTATDTALLPPPESEDLPTTSTETSTATPTTTAPATTTASTDGTTNPNCGYVRVNTAVGTVQMRAPRNVLDEADQIIRRAEAIANRRLVLEARVLAVTRNRNYDQQGGFINGRANETGNSLGIGAPGSIAASLSRALTGFGTTGSGANLTGFSLKNQNLDAVVSFLERYSTTYQLMHPVMELMDRQRGTLIDGTNQKYFIVRNTTTTGTATSTSSDVEERSQFLGLQFSAAAQISDDPNEPHTISLQIPITSKAGEVNIPTGISGTIAGVAPIANTRLIDQKVRVRDGEIKAIGGLTMTVATDRESGMPLLRDIPVAGKLANDEGIEYQQVEFVILLQVKRLN
jgi:type II secretory pathway component GspD/PulD (secretin)